jgi:pathogenesis-related protein 1
MRTHSLALIAALGGCGQMYKSPGGTQAEPAQPGVAPTTAGGPPGGGDPWTPEPTNSAAMPPEAPREAPPARPPAPAPAAPAGDAERLVAAHNKVRAQHCAQPLTWSPKLAQFAQQWANTLRDQGCKFGHSGGKYGENLAAGTTGAMDPESVVAMWYDEVKGYSFKQPGFSMQTGHFTQVVWRGTTQVGCAMVQCKGNDVWVCEYDPPGNWEGKYREQVLPVGCK